MKYAEMGRVRNSSLGDVPMFPHVQGPDPAPWVKENLLTALTAGFAFCDFLPCLKFSMTTPFKSHFLLAHLWGPRYCLKTLTDQTLFFQI